MFSSSIKKILNAEVFGITRVCSENSVLRLVGGSICSSLLVGIRANSAHSKVIRDKTGCHRFACNVSWAWFLLWAGSAALHFYSNLPKTIPCVMWARSLSDAEDKEPGDTDVCKPCRFFPAGPLDTTSFTLQQQGLAECTREDSSAPPPSLSVRNQNGLGLSVTAASS